MRSGKILFIGFGIVVLLCACKQNIERQIQEPTHEEIIHPPFQEEASSTPTAIEKEPESNESEVIVEEQKIEQVSKPAKPKVKKIANILFDQTSYDFGEIEEGEKITHKFNFRNTGNAPLTINDVQVSCGCTVPSYPIMPIGPGESGSIGVVFDSKGKFGSQRPFITVKSNTSEKLTKLYLTGSIKHVFEKTAPKDTTKISEQSNS